MGQQQLLLIILVTIIVGIATVVAINTFSSASDSANVDAVRQDLLTMASKAQQYYMKPDMMGGGGNSFVDVALEDVCPTQLNASDACVNENGTYTISTAGTASGVSFQGVPANAGGSITIDVVKDDATMNDYTPGS